MRQEVDAAALQPIPGRQHLLVLDAPNGGLAGAAVFTLDGERGHLALLSISRDLEGNGLEDRFIAVIEAMCKAFGAKCLDIPGQRAAYGVH